MNWGGDPRAPAANFKILGLPDNGTYAELIAMPAAHVFTKPESISFEEAAAVPLALLTAYRALVTRAQLQAGETCLITGIGGGVSSFVLQLALAIGARVLVTSSSDAKLEEARKMGAAGGANYRTQDWGKEILGLCNERGLQVVIDSAGEKPSRKRSIWFRPVDVWSLMAPQPVRSGNWKCAGSSGSN